MEEYRFCTEYEEFCIHLNNFAVCSEGVVLQDGVVFPVRVVSAIFRSENPTDYDASKGYDSYAGNFDYSGEFILDNDCIYAFLERIV